MAPRTLLLILLGIAGLGVLIERLIVTDIEAIEGLVADAQEAFNERAFSDLEPLLHADFGYGGRDRRETILYLERLSRRFQAGATVVMEQPRIEGDQATAPAQVRLRVINQFSELPVSLEFVRTEAGWLVRRATLGVSGR